MKKLALVLLLLPVLGFAQSGNKAIEILHKNVDTAYFAENGTHWSEFTLPPLRAYRIMDLVEADTSLHSCDIVKGKKNYLQYLKYDGSKPTKTDKQVIGYLRCDCAGYFVLMWMYEDYAFGGFMPLPVEE